MKIGANILMLVGFNLFGIGLWRISPTLYFMGSGVILMASGVVWAQANQKPSK